MRPTQINKKKTISFIEDHLPHQKKIKPLVKNDSHKTLKEKNQRKEDHLPHEKDVELLQSSFRHLIKHITCKNK